MNLFYFVLFLVKLRTRNSVNVNIGQTFDYTSTHQQENKKIHLNRFTNFRTVLFSVAFVDFVSIIKFVCYDEVN